MDVSLILFGKSHVVDLDKQPDNTELLSVLLTSLSTVESHDNISSLCPI